MKKILALLCMIACISSLTACGKEVETLSYDEASIENACFIAFSNIAMEYTPDILESIQAYTSDQWDEIEENLKMGGLNTTGNVLLKGIESFGLAQEDIGIVSQDEMPTLTYSADKDSLTVEMMVNGSVHDAQIEFIFDKDLHMTSIAVNPQYSFGEQMIKAALNTLMGMGTVFAVLILISVIISGFSLIPKMFALKEAPKAVETKVASVVETVAELPVENLADDLELAAVIAAAISASQGATSTEGFMVRSIRKRRA